jgi:esterase
MRLNFIKYGKGDATPIVIAHGLYGSARNWGVIARRLAQTRPVFAVDMRNHAGSDWADTNSYADLAGDLAETIDFIGGPVDLVGHSMGGKAAMVLALAQPRALNHLIVVDIAPVAYAHTQKHVIDAALQIDLDLVSSRKDADAQLSHFLTEPTLRSFLLQSLDISGELPRWRLNFDVLAKDMEQIVGFPKVQGQFSGPVLFLKGDASDYVKDAYRSKILSLFPNAEIVPIQNAGHWLHAENPRATEAAILEFL